MYNVCMRFFGEMWASFREGVIPLHPALQAFPQCLADTHKHTHTCTKALTVCNSIFCPTGLLPPGVSHGGGVPIKFRAVCQDSVKLIERAVSAQARGIGGGVWSQVRYLSVWDVFIKYITLGCRVEYFGARANRPLAQLSIMTLNS